MTREAIEELGWLIKIYTCKNATEIDKRRVKALKYAISKLENMKGN